MQTIKPSSADKNKRSSGYHSAGRGSGGPEDRESSYPKNDAEITVKSCYATLKEEISPELLPDYLIRILDERKIQEIQQQPTTYKKNDVLLKGVLQKMGKDNTVCDKFMDILDETFGYDFIPRIKEIQEKKRRKFAESSFDYNIEDFDFHKECVVGKMDAEEVADYMFENKDVSTSEHDLILSKGCASMKAETLLQIVHSNNKINRLIEALHYTGHDNLLQEMALPKSEQVECDLMEVDEKVPVEHSLVDSDGDIIMKLEFNTEENHNICTSMIHIYNTDPEYNSGVQNYAIEHFNCNLNNLTNGCVKITLSPLLKDSVSCFNDAIQSGDLSSFLKTLLADKRFENILPHEDFKVTITIRKEAKPKSDKPSQISDEDIVLFRYYMIFLVDRFPPNWILRKLKDDDRISKILPDELPSSFAKRRVASLDLMRQIFESSETNDLKHFIKLFQKLLNDKTIDEARLRCPHCCKKFILYKYKNIIAEMSRRTSAFVDDIWTQFEGRKGLLDDDGKTSNRKLFAQKVVQRALQSIEATLDLITVLTVNGHVITLPNSCEENLTVESQNPQGSSIPDSFTREWKIQKTFIVSLNRGRENHGEETEKEIREEEKIPTVQVVVDGDTETVMMRRKHHSSKPILYDESETTIDPAAVIVTETDRNDSNLQPVGQNGEMQLSVKDQGYYSKEISPRQSSTDA